ncbi:MAG: diacylglycerol/polyprenol kinase family protein [Candidatus Methanomethylophilaceae archaeon]
METQDIIALALVYAIIIVSLASALILERKGIECNVRKVVHIGVGFFVFVWWMFTEGWVMLAFFTIPFAIILFLPMVSDRAMPVKELNDLTVNKGHRTGLFLYAVTISLMIIFFGDHWTAATIGIVAMTFGDGFGSVIGRRYGKHRAVNGKSLEGSLGVFVATAVMAAVIMVYYGWLTSAGYYPGGDSIAVVPIWAASIVAGLVSTVVEAVCPGQLDNIVNPMAVAVTMVLLGL